MFAYVAPIHKLNNGRPSVGDIISFPLAAEREALDSYYSRLAAFLSAPSQQSGKAYRLALWRYLRDRRSGEKEQAARLCVADRRIDRLTHNGGTAA